MIAPKNTFPLTVLSRTQPVHAYDLKETLERWKWRVALGPEDEFARGFVHPARPSEVVGDAEFPLCALNERWKLTVFRIDRWSVPGALFRAEWDKAMKQELAKSGKRRLDGATKVQIRRAVLLELRRECLPAPQLIPLVIDTETQLIYVHNTNEKTLALLLESLGTTANESPAWAIRSNRPSDLWPNWSEYTGDAPAEASWQARQFSKWIVAELLKNDNRGPGAGTDEEDGDENAATALDSEGNAIELFIGTSVKFTLDEVQTTQRSSAESEMLYRLERMSGSAELNQIDFCVSLRELSWDFRLGHAGQIMRVRVPNMKVLGSRQEYSDSYPDRQSDEAEVWQSTWLLYAEMTRIAVFEAYVSLFRKSMARFAQLPDPITQL